ASPRMLWALGLWESFRTSQSAVAERLPGRGRGEVPGQRCSDPRRARDPLQGDAGTGWANPWRAGAGVL
ncbi:MAG: hypothetical protein AVDCRST_MAG28-4167, partial [uncultured Rubrobacteraceae bacterium]